MYEQHKLGECFADFTEFFDLYEPHNVWLWDEYGNGRVTKDYLEFDRMFFPLTRAPRPWPVDKAMEVAKQMREEHLRLTTRFFSLLPDAAEVVRKLASHFPLVIVSNGFVEVQYEKIRRSGLADCFAYVVLSEEVGVSKPQPDIFRVALAKGGWQAEEVLMIGDSWSSDIQGAINAGIDQLWITSEPETPDRCPTYRCSSLREVLNML